MGFEDKYKNKSRKDLINELEELYQTHNFLKGSCDVILNDRKQTELEIKRVNEKLRVLSEALEQSPVVIVLTDLHGNIEYVNSKFKETTGYSEHEAIGKNPRILKTNLHPDEYYKALWETVLSGKTWKGVFQNKKKNGTLYWESAVISPIKNEKGVIVNILAVKEDITEQRNTQEALRISKAKYKSLSMQLEAILDHIPGLVFYKDMHNNFIRVNKYVAQAYGRPKEELEGMNLSKLHSVEDSASYYKDDMEVINSGVARINIVERWETKEGIRWVNTCKIPFVDANNVINGVIGISMDITSLKSAEEVIIQQNHELTELNTTKDKFFSIISHDLRGPLNAIINFTDLLFENIEKNDKPKSISAAKILTMASLHMNDLLNNLLEWASIQLHRTSLIKEELDLKVMTDKCIGHLSAQAEHKSISIDNQIPKDLKIVADVHIMLTVLRNLMSNAIKYSNINGTVSIGATQLESEIKVFVSDQGIGMNSSLLETIFKLNTIASRTGTANEKGTGLGLILCNDYIEKHGGRIWAESIVNKGSTFYFTLPVK